MREGPSGNGEGKGEEGEGREEEGGEGGVGGEGREGEGLSPRTKILAGLVEMNKHILIFLSPSVSHRISVCPYQNIMAIFRRGPPNWAKIAIFYIHLDMASITAGPLSCRQHFDGGV